MLLDNHVAIRTVPKRCSQAVCRQYNMTTLEMLQQPDGGHVVQAVLQPEGEELLARLRWQHHDSA